MPGWVKGYVRIVEAINYRVGRFAMYLLFFLMGLQLFSSIWRIISRQIYIPYSFWRDFPIPDPSIWTLEMSQFTLMGYIFLGGAYSIQLGSNVRMDLVYGQWSDRTRMLVDVVSIFALIFYLGVLLYGGVSSASYAIEVGERNPTAWRPYMAPLKIILCIGIFLMLLQSTALFFKDLAKLRGEEI